MILAITSGEPAGVGPELCAALVQRDWPARLVVIGDRQLIAERGAEARIVNYLETPPSRETLRELLGKLGIAAADLMAWLPHQANARILDATARKLKLSPDRVVVTVDRHANTSAASVPLALDQAVRDGRIVKGDLVVLEAMGGGFTWGAALLEF